tara:strand:+ start:7400 stop:9787 length:2388 start_codon:yes stop_codon:yes gene_type:complete
MTKLRILFLAVFMGFSLFLRAQEEVAPVSQKYVTLADSKVTTVSELKKINPRNNKSNNAKDTNFYNPLEEVVVSAYRTAESKRNITQEISVIRSKEIQNSLERTTVDVLSSQNSVAIQKSQQGGGSIILRGMEASRVLLVVDGIRMNNLIYRSGHLQNAITVDPNVLERIEVSFGPTSNAYGSDALGGVVHFITETPEFSVKRKYSWSEKVQYSSVNNSSITNLKFNFSDKRFASLTSLTSSVYGDLKSGKRINPYYGESHGDRNYYVHVGMYGDTILQNKNPHLQIGSSYSQVDLLQKFVYKTKKNRTSTFNIQYSNSSDVPRYDRLTDLKPGAGPGSNKLKYSSWHYGPQKRFLSSYQWKALRVFGFDGVRVSVYHQNIEESRMTRRFGSSILKSRKEEVVINGFNSDATKRLGTNVFRIGIDGSHQRVYSSATGENVFDPSIVFDTSLPGNFINTRYPGGKNVMINLAAFATHVNNISDKLKVSEGFRIGMTQLSSAFTNSDFFPMLTGATEVHIYQRNPVASGSIGLIYQKSKQSKFSSSISTAYRVPNIDDLAKVFDSRPGVLIIPNPNLRPEQAFTAEIGNVQLFKGGHSLEWNLYSTSLRDALVVIPSQYNGSDSIIFEGVESAILSQSNARNARIAGYSIRCLVVLPFSFSLKGQFQGVAGGVTRSGVQLQGDQGTHMPLDHIPPRISRVGLQFNPTNSFSADLYVVSNAKKSLDKYCPNGEDNQRYATPMGTPRWVTWNAVMSYDLNSQWIFQFGVHNILDTQYRTFASGINAPGRNITASIKNSF